MSGLPLPVKTPRTTLPAALTSSIPMDDPVVTVSRLTQRSIALTILLRCTSVAFFTLVRHSHIWSECHGACSIERHAILSGCPSHFVCSQTHFCNGSVFSGSLAVVVLLTTAVGTFSPTRTDCRVLATAPPNAVTIAIPTMTAIKFTQTRLKSNRWSCSRSALELLDSGSSSLNAAGVRFVTATLVVAGVTSTTMRQYKYNDASEKAVTKDHVLERTSRTKVQVPVSELNAIASSRRLSFRTNERAVCNVNTNNVVVPAIPNIALTNARTWSARTLRPRSTASIKTVTPVTSAISPAPRPIGSALIGAAANSILVRLPSSVMSVDDAVGAAEHGNKLPSCSSVNAMRKEEEKRFIQRMHQATWMLQTNFKFFSTWDRYSLPCPPHGTH